MRPRVNVVKPAEYTDRLFDSSKPPNAVIRYGTAIQVGSMSRIAMIGSVAWARSLLPTDSKPPRVISNTSGIPAPNAADATRRTALTLRC
ncbi:hypothetical protein D3C87_1655150 [compost metagenome]